MQKRLRKTLVVVSAMVAMMAMTVTASFAQQRPPYPPGRGLEIACEASGNQVVCVLAGAGANERIQVRVTCDGRNAYRTTVLADADGEGNFSFTAPAGAEDCTIEVLGAVGSARSSVALAAREAAGAPVTPGRDRLPFTGGEVGIFLAAGLVLLGGGLVVLRRREDSRISVD